jgi:hypothetical protein
LRKWAVGSEGWDWARPRISRKTRMGIGARRVVSRNKIFGDIILAGQGNGFTTEGTEDTEEILGTLIDAHLR